MSFKSSLLKSTDAFVGPLFCGLLSRSQTQAEHRRIQDIDAPVLVIRPGGIGDAVMLLPMLQALQDSLPNRPIDILCESRNIDIFRLARPDSKVIAFDKNPLGALSTLRHAGYGCVIDTEQFHHFSGVMAALTRAPLRIGFKINTRRRGLYTHLVSYDLDGPEDVQFGRLLAAACGRVVTLPPRVGILASASLPDITQDLPFRETFLLIHAGGSIACKRCPPETLASIAQTVFAEFQMKTVLVGNTEDIPYAESIARTAGTCTLDQCGRLTLAKTAALCRRATALLGPDSGIAHLAVALGTPAVVLFGPSDPAKWGPPPGCGEAIRTPLPCSPCSIFGYTKPCENPECISGITEDQVLESLRRTLSKRINEK